MRFMGRVATFAILAVLLLVVVGAAFGAAAARRVSDGRIIPFEEMIAEIRKGSLIFVGEFHETRVHHELQLAVIAGLEKTGDPLAIGLEMFSIGSQVALDRWISGKMSVDEFRKVYRDNWTIDWEQYESILMYARDRRIPLIALNAPKEVVQKVNKTGFASVTAREKENLPPGITCRIDTPYMKFVRKMYGEHDMGGVTFEHFCEAQSVRNQTMAWVAVKYLKQNPRQRMVVITGIGHAMKRGVPEEVQQLSDLKYSVIIPRIAPALMETIKVSDADFVILDL